MYEKTIRAHVLGNTEHFYIDPKNCETLIPVGRLEKAENWSQIKDKDSINGIVIFVEPDQTMNVVQAAGYNRDRGMFCDLY